MLDPLVFGKRPREVTSREKATRFVSKDLLVFLEPLSVFQDKTLCEELWYLDVLCLTAIARIKLLHLLNRSFLTLADKPTFLATFGPMSTWKQQI